jgi:uncharacterized membrane protein SirB2
MKKLIPKIIDVICFVGGTVLVLFYATDFQLVISHLKYSQFPDDWKNNYYLEANHLIFVLIGIGLIILGFLIRSWRKS